VDLRHKFRSCTAQENNSVALNDQIGLGKVEGLGAEGVLVPIPGAEPKNLNEPPRISHQKVT
jgi:hypothetical protein